MTRQLTPHMLHLVERLGPDAVEIAAHARLENRFHATGHGIADPDAYGREVVAAYRAATDADIARCREVNQRLARDLGIA